MGGDGPLVAVGVDDAAEAVAVELVSGLGDGGGAGGKGLGVDGVAVGDVEVSFRLLLHYASSVSHQKYHGVDIVTVRVESTR